MPPVIKGFAAGSILMSFFIFILTGIVGWFGTQAVRMPVVEDKVSTTVGRLDTVIKSVQILNTNMAVLSSKLAALTEQAGKTNEALTIYTKHNAENIHQLIIGIAKVSTRVSRNEKECERLRNRENGYKK